MCDALTSNGNELYEPPSNQRKAYTDTDSDGKTEIITDITCKFKGKLVAMEVKVDPGSETNCIPYSSGTCSLSNAERMAIPRRMPWNQLWLSLKHMMVASWPAMDGSYCLLGTSETATSFILWDTMWWPGRRPGSWSVMLQQLGWDSWRSYVQTRHPGSKGK